MGSQPLNGPAVEFRRCGIADFGLFPHTRYLF